MEEREGTEDREKEMWSGRGEAQQILSGGEIALLRIYCFKCNWVQPAPGEEKSIEVSSPARWRALPALPAQPCC